MDDLDDRKFKPEDPVKSQRDRSSVVNEGQKRQPPRQRVSYDVSLVGYYFNIDTPEDLRRANDSSL
jgi:hypothetical protein